MEVMFIDGTYKGCEALTFKKGLEEYFRDDEDNSEILLSNHLYIKKGEVLEDVLILLNKAKNSNDEKSFLEDIHSLKIKESKLLRENIAEKFYSYRKIIEEMFVELVRIENEEQKVFELLLMYIQDLQTNELKAKYETGNYDCVVKGKGYIVVEKFNGFNDESILPKGSFEFGYSNSMKCEYIKVHNGSHIVYANNKEDCTFYLKHKDENKSKYLNPDYQFALGDSFYHIDEPNHKGEIVKLANNYAYLIIPHPSICKAFVIRTMDIGKTFFENEEDCIDARIARLKRELDLEKSFKDRKI